MRCWWRRIHGNRIGSWQEGEEIHLKWIRAYFDQPIRDLPVWIVVRDEDGDLLPIRCWSDSNDKIRGEMDDGSMDIVWARPAIGEAVLHRYP